VENDNECHYPGNPPPIIKYLRPGEIVKKYREGFGVKNLIDEVYAAKLFPDEFGAREYVECCIYKDLMEGAKRDK